MPTVNRKEIEFTLQGAEAAKAILKPIFFDDSAELFEVMPMVTSEQKMAYASVMRDVIQRAISCGMRPQGEIDIYERTISTDNMGVYVNQCFDEALNTAYTSLYKQGKDITDLTGTVFSEILITRVQEAIKKHIEKLAFFGDKASADASINLVDGVWTYLFDLVANNLVPYVDSNSGSPLVAGDGIDLLTAMYEEQRNELKALAPGEKIFLVSGNVFHQYEKDLREGSINSSAYTMNVQDGGLGVKFQNIEVRPMWDWEQYAAQYLGVQNANLAVLTSKDNLVIATDVENQDNNLEVWYDRDSELNKVRSRFRLGFNYKLEEFFVAAF